MSNKRQEFFDKVLNNPLVVGQLNKIGDEEKRKGAKRDILTSCEEMAHVYEVLSNALEDPEVLKQVIEELRGTNVLVNVGDVGTAEKKKQ